MDAVIKEGALRLYTTETTCDVIISCQGDRLMAHKLILSIASPILRNLLLQEPSSPAVLILPDINAHTMSSLLDYIYTGSVVVYSDLIDDFLSVAKLLDIKLSPFEKDISCSHSSKLEEKIKPDNDSNNNKNSGEDATDIYSRKNLKKLPNLLPIKKQQIRYNQKKLCSPVVVPSPWCPRIETIMMDPRKDYHTQGNVVEMANTDGKFAENDNNNNFQYHPSLLSYPSNYLQRTPLELTYPLPNQKLSYPAAPIVIPTDRNLLEPSLESSSSFLLASQSVEKELLLPSSSSPKLPTNINHNSSGRETDDDKLSSSEERYNKNSEATTTQKKPFKCEDCGKCFSQLRNYKYHRSVHEGTKEFAAKCPECGKVFNDRGYLSSHMKIHRDRKEYACPHCPKRFNQRVAYNMHLRIHTGVKPHECNVCGKSFSRKMLLKQHQRVHTGERPYSCPECGKTFADRSNMSLHARLHTGVKPYACTLCPKSFTKKHHLKTHMNFHTGLKPYTCQKCGLAFSQSSNMRTHYKKCILKSGGNTYQSQLNANQSSNSSQIDAIPRATSPSTIPILHSTNENS